MCQNCEITIYTDMTPEENAEDMLINSDLYIGGVVGVGPKEAMAYLKGRGFVGPGCGLTKKGVAEARRLAREWDERP